MAQDVVQTVQNNEDIRRRGLFPKRTLEESLVIPQGLQDQNAGRPMNKILLAQAIQRTPSSSEYKMLLSSSYQYGLTLGTEKADQVSLTEKGVAITKPTSEKEKLDSIRSAVLIPSAFKDVFLHYKNAKLPKDELFKNVLERQFNIPRQDTEVFINIFKKNGLFTNMLKEVNGEYWVVLDSDNNQETSSVVENVTEGIQLEQDESNGQEDINQKDVPASPENQKIFIGHGKDERSLEQLKKILDQFKIPYAIAVNEPNKALPVSEKIASIMRECNAGIFLFTADEKLTNGNGQEISRPSENVIYELGAASVLYGNRIVIFKETEVTFPSDFSGIGYISFEQGELSSKTVELLKELIDFNLVKITV